MRWNPLFFSALFYMGVVQANPPPTIQPQTRPSLKSLGARLKEAERISALFKESLQNSRALTAKSLAPLEKANQELHQDFAKAAARSESFVRGEIEDENVMSPLLSLLQLSLLKIRLLGQDHLTLKEAVQVREEAGLWFQFAADLPYNEASLVGLKVTGVVRSLLLDELERLQNSAGEMLAMDRTWLDWLKGLRTPWPVDRMLLTEARRLLSPASQNLAEKVAVKIQKNPYLSVESALKQIPGGKPGEIEMLKKLWRDQDMEGLKTEINRLQKLRLQAASQVYKKQKKAAPASVQQLLDERLLVTAPMDYFTGRPLELPQTDKK